MDPYQILGVSRTATPEEIRAAYLRLVKIHHPDKNPDKVASANEQFLRIKSAYESLRASSGNTGYQTPEQEAPRDFDSANRDFFWSFFGQEFHSESFSKDIFGSNPFHQRHSEEERRAAQEKSKEELRAAYLWAHNEMLAALEVYVRAVTAAERFIRLGDYIGYDSEIRSEKQVYLARLSRLELELFQKKGEATRSVHGFW